MELRNGRRCHERERGQVLPLIAGMLVSLLGFGGMAVDAGYWEYQQRQAQNAADAAALGGAQQLAYAGCPDQSAAETSGQTDATANGYSNGPHVAVTIANPPASGPYAGNDCAVYAQITTTSVPSFFSKLFGMSQGVTESTEAVAVVSGTNPGCLYLLDQSATVNLNGDVLLAPHCAVYANSADVETMASVINVKRFSYAHSIQSNLLSLYLGAQPGQMLPVADPCPEITSCAYLAGNPPPAGGCTRFVNFSPLPTTVNPGCYSDFENNLGVVTMEPGLYIFTGAVNNTGVLVGDGVTMYVASTGGPVSLDGSAALLAPPTTGTDAGVLLYQVPGNTNPVAFNASANLSLAGLVYAPSAMGEILGRANITFGHYVVFVLDNMKLLAGINLALPGPDNGQSLIKSASLAE